MEVTGATLKGTVIQGKEVAQLLDELPVLAVAGALANGTTIIRQAQELRVKETDRIAAIAHNLRVMGAQVIELSDGLEIHGPAPLRGGRVASCGDHRIAMAFAVAGLFADGETIVQEGKGAGANPIRWSFSDIAPKSFRWRGEVSADGGATWRLNVEFFARRVETG